jgi:hypothetical protein
MSVVGRSAILGVALAASWAAAAEESAPAAAREISGSASISHYAFPDEQDLDVGVAALNFGALRFEARHNYEARHATSAFVGWKFAGGDAVTYEVTPILGGLFGSVHGVVPGVEASLGWRSFDVYVEAEYVHDTQHSSDSYFYTWDELGWRPVEHLRLGLVGQRTRIVQNDRSLQRGLFAQLTFEHGSVAVYAFNPEAGSRYTVFTLALSF